MGPGLGLVLGLGLGLGLGSRLGWGAARRVGSDHACGKGKADEPTTRGGHVGRQGHHLPPVLCDHLS